MLYHVKNRTSGVRKFQGGGRYLTLVGGETERNIDLSKDEADAIRATNEFALTEAEPKTIKEATAVSAGHEQPKPVKGN